MRDALSTLDQVIAFCGEKVEDAEVQSLLGMVDRRLLFDTAEAVVQRDSRRALESIRRVDELGHSFRQFTQELVEVFRSLILLKVTEDPGELLSATPDELRELQALTDAGSLEDHQRTLTLLLRTEAELASSSFPRLSLEMVLVRVANLPPARDVGALLRKIEELEGRLAASRGAVPNPASPPTAPREAQGSAAKKA